MMTINDNDFRKLVFFVREHFGINLEQKRQLIEARLSFDISKKGYSDFTKYVNQIIATPDGDECKHMMNKLSTNYTFFFRETDYIRHLCDHVLPELIARKRTHIKIWSAACASGQEAYSIAMVLEQKKKIGNLNFDYEITGTDINTETLKIAAQGIYARDELFNIPKQYHHFIQRHDNESFQISDSIKNRISWKYRNLIDPASEWDRYDIIFCRNVLIYFTPQLRGQMTAKLHSVLLPQGYLYTGATESIDLERKYFLYIAPTIYRKA